MRDVVERLERAGIRLQARGDKLRLVPKDWLTPELIELARQHKTELMAYGRAREIATWCEANHVDVKVATEIVRIEGQAVAAGWPVQHLWGHRFWPISERGLVAVMDRDDQIVGVSSEAITILKLRRDVQRFYRRNS